MQRLEEDEDDLLVGVPIMTSQSSRQPCSDTQATILKLVADEQKPTLDIVLELDQVGSL